MLVREGELRELDWGGGVKKLVHKNCARIVGLFFVKRFYDGHVCTVQCCARVTQKQLGLDVDMHICMHDKFVRTPGVLDCFFVKRFYDGYVCAV